MTLHKEGRATITIALVFLSILNLTVWRLGGHPYILGVLLLASVIVFGLILWFFRKPNRPLPTEDDSKIFAPADGKVVVIEDTIESEYFEDERLMISIFMSPLNVHSNHHPVSGTVSYEKYHAGKYLVTWHPKSSTENERHTTVYKTKNTEILCRQIAGALARRIVNYTRAGQAVKQGGEMGFIKFGSRVDVYLPVGTDYKVKLGQVVKAKETVIALV